MRGIPTVVKRTSTFAVGIVAVLGATWVAWAQVGSSGTVLGCVSPSGLIRGIDEATGTCRTTDATLSWYTKDGADAMFLRKTEAIDNADNLDGLDSSAFLRTSAKAWDADSLDGWDSSHYLTMDTGVGGALAGTLPSPTLAPNAVGRDAIQPGAVTADKLDPSLSLGFGGGVSVVDSNDVEVGRIVSRTGDVLARVANDTFIAPVTRLGFVPGGTFIHREAGCGDVPLITSTFNRDALAQVALVKPGEAWVPDLSAAQVHLPALTPVFTQTFLANGTSTPCAEATISSDIALTPLRMVSLSGFSPEFRLR